MRFALTSLVALIASPCLGQDDQAPAEPDIEVVAVAKRSHFAP